ncbi:hypothetical protein [Hahella ganghwensis]|uniref:hypothetical protein n=1 Tax=Hahella ganghwensis TaxID=286420 RepID=UPI00039C44D6|nr:hypothetical protein [Hahella ganghwensis]
MKVKYAGPSTNDVFALLLAQQEDCPLLSGDRDLRAAAESELVEVRGTLWLVEELVKHELIDTRQAHEAYNKMEAVGRRLPLEKARLRLADL